MKEIEPPGPLQIFLYRFAQAFSQILFRAVYRLEVKGREHIPSKGAVLIASNHISNLDPPLIGSSIFRPIHYFAKEELFKIPIFGWLIQQINAFPVKRFEHDIGAFKKAQSLLNQGEAVLLFPEGRRSKTGELGAPRPGIGLLAFNAQVPVVPACVINTDKPLQFKKIKLYFGPPIFPKAVQEKSDHIAFSKAVMAAIADLKSKNV